MSWTYYTDAKGRNWRINQLGLWILARQHVYNTLIRRRSHIRRVTRLFGPNEVSVETDFRGIAAERDQQSFPLYAVLEREAIENGAQILDRLIQMRHETECAVREVRHMQQSTSHEMFQNIEQSVHRGEIAVEAATQVRDLAATTLVVGSAFVTGGASVAVLGGGSVLRGVARYQDRGNVGSAILTATGTFVVGAIPLTGGSLGAGASVTARVGGEAINYGERATLVVVGAQLDAQFQACNALIEGRSGRQALGAAGARFPAALISGLLGIGLDRWALPILLRLVSDSAVAAVADATVDRLSVARAPTARAAAPTARAAASTPLPTNPAICDANAVLSTGSCSPRDWVHQIVLQPA